MGFFKKKPDPISERARALESEIKELESQIRKLSHEAEEAPPQPKLRSTAQPLSEPKPARVSPDPVFEETHAAKLVPEAVSTPDHYNDLGVRKYDLAAAWKRLKNHVHGPPVNNPKMVNLLAAGSIQGLRPLRYEKRVARNRFLVVALGALLLLFGLIFFLVVNRP